MSSDRYTALEKRNLELTKQWEWTWNHAVDRMVDECYAANCEVTDMLRQRTFRGREELRAIEHQMMEADASRRMQITRMMADDDRVIVEVDAHWRNSTIIVKGCVVLTYDRDGKIAVDHSYSADPTGAAR